MKHWNIKRRNGDLYLEDQDLMGALNEVVKQHDVTLSRHINGQVLAETEENAGGVAEWGAGPTVEVALRFCIGACLATEEQEGNSTTTWTWKCSNDGTINPWELSNCSECGELHSQSGEPKPWEVPDAV